MAQLSPQKRKKRRIQLREAQRRRRARLKEESKSFLQIILSQETLLALRNYGDIVGKPLHQCAADLIEMGLRYHQKPQSRQREELQSVTDSEELLRHNGEFPEDSDQTPPPERTASTREISAGQMELFAG